MFKGFQPGTFESLMIPPGFFSELLPQIDDLAELKVLLFCFWALPQKESTFPYLLHHDFIHHEPLMTGLAALDTGFEPEAVLSAALNGLVKRGVLLQTEIDMNAQKQIIFVVNTERGRLAFEQLRQGRWTLNGDIIEILPERPNIYKLYEENIGPLTPLIADNLKDIEQDYSSEWVADALKIAVQNNKRSLKYIHAILKRWQEEGRSSDAQPRRRIEEGGKRYITGKYADFIDH
ncbi:MAG: hypothetical protein CUN56_10960 [Phototrophicales bacterium]|nr:MAG: hypothetical protein CUN56_10960 [Phototrophicales bacterium]RMG71425.1 MAG: DnaD domain protein [Chloroflexota bacterium]